MSASAWTLDVLETLIDKTSLQDVLGVLAEVCKQKAEYIRANWPNDLTADEWENDAKVILKAATKVRR